MQRLEKNKGLSPKQIHAKNIRQRMKAKADQLRDEIRIENRIKALPFEEKKQIKLDLLKLNGYDREKPIRQQSMKLRILYFLKCDDMHKNKWVAEYYRGEYLDGI